MVKKITNKIHIIVPDSKSNYNLWVKKTFNSKFQIMREKNFFKVSDYFLIVK